MKEPISELIKKEGWEVVKKDDELKILAYGKEFPYRHPVQIHLKLYREETNPDQKFEHMKAAHFYLRPDLIKTWHYWTEDRFRAHCEGWNYITYAGGASTSKSHDMASIAAIFWLANPSKRGVIVSSTTLESLGARIWGYTTKYFQKLAVPLPFQYTGGNTPKILAVNNDPNALIKKDTLHGMFAVAAKQGDVEKSISSWIGRHPDDALMLVLDEATDITANVLQSFANLDSGDKLFQCYAIGNSNSTDDLHGAMSTPKAGWEKIDPLTMKRWETTQKNGLCLFFSCYESPAIHEPDETKKKLLSKFLISAEKIEEKKKELGDTSDAFWRFTLGFWKHKSTESVIASEQFIKNFGSDRRAHFGPVTPISVVGGLDLAFSTGGDNCILRMAVLGVDVNGLYVLDFREDEITHIVPIMRNVGDAAEIQIGKQVMNLIGSYNCPLQHIALDATGQGRAMGGVLQLMDKGISRPICIYTTKAGVNQDKSWDVVIKTSYELWFTLREFIQAGQIRGLDNKTIMQLSERQVVYTKGGQPALESKADYKKRISAKYPGQGHSPDQADSAALCLQSAIMNFGFKIGQRREVPQAHDFKHEKWLEYRAEQQRLQEATQVQKQTFVPQANFKKGLEEMIKRRPF